MIPLTHVPIFVEYVLQNYVLNIQDKSIQVNNDEKKHLAQPQDTAAYNKDVPMVKADSTHAGSLGSIPSAGREKNRGFIAAYKQVKDPLS